MPAKSHQPNSMKLSEKGTKFSTSRVGYWKKRQIPKWVAMIFKEWDAASKRQSYEYYCYYFWGIIGNENSNKRPQDKGKRSTVTVKMECLIMQEERKEILSFLPWGKEESQAHTCSLLEAALATQIALLPIPSPDNQAPLSLSLSVSVFSLCLCFSLCFCLCFCVFQVCWNLWVPSPVRILLFFQQWKGKLLTHKYKERGSWKVYAVEKRKNAWPLWEQIMKLLGELIENTL